MKTKAFTANLATLLIAPTTAKAITKVGFGESDVAETPDDTALLNPYMKQINSSRVVDSTSVEITYSLGYNEANGKTIKEIGLFTTDGTLLVREVKNTILKDADTSYDGIMTILL